MRVYVQLVLFAAREAVKESLGFNPFEFVLEDPFVDH